MVGNELHIEFYNGTTNYASEQSLEENFKYDKSTLTDPFLVEGVQEANKFLMAGELLK